VPAARTLFAQTVSLSNGTIFTPSRSFQGPDPRSATGLSQLDQNYNVESQRSELSSDTFEMFPCSKYSTLIEPRCDSKVY